MHECSKNSSKAVDVFILYMMSLSELQIVFFLFFPGRLTDTILNSHHHQTLTAKMYIFQMSD